MKTLLTVILSLVTIMSFSQEAELERNIRKMLEIQGIEKTWEIAITNLIQVQKEAHPEIDPEFWIRFEKEVIDDAYAKLFDLVVPIYKKHLTASEVNAIIAFYETDAGKSLIAKTPLILQESMEAGSKLGEKISTQIVNEIEEEKNLNYESDHSGCEKFKVGRFKFYLPDSSLLTIERDKKFQYEYHGGNTTKYRIKWLSECRYMLKIIKTDNEIMKDAKGNEVLTNIYETGDGYYKFVSTAKGMEDFKLDGTIYKIE